MLDPFNYERVRRYLTWTFILIIFMVITGIAVAGEQILHSKIKSISPEKTDGQYFFVKVVRPIFFPSIFEDEQCKFVLSKINIDPISHS